MPRIRKAFYRRPGRPRTTLPVSALPLVRKSQWFVSCRKNAASPDGTETDHSYYIKPYSPSSYLDRSMFIPIGGMVLSDESGEGSPEYPIKCDSRMLSRQESFWIKGVKLHTTLQWRSDFNVYFFLVDIPAPQYVDRVDPEETDDQGIRFPSGEHTGVDVVSLNFGNNGLMDGQQRSLQLWDVHQMHLPIEQRALNRKFRTRMREKIELRVNESKQWGHMPVNLWGPIGKWYHKNFWRGDPGGFRGERQGGYSTQWIVYWEHVGTSFETEGTAPGTAPDDLHQIRKPDPDTCALVFWRFHQHIFFREQLLPLPIVGTQPVSNEGFVMQEFQARRG